MLKFELTEVEETPYLYEERTCGMDPSDISAAMGEAFGTVMRFMGANGIEPAGAPMAVYYTYDPSKMTFRAGFAVSADDLEKAEAAVKGAVTPAGEALTFTHVGPYAELRNSYGVMMKHMEQNNLQLGAPTWEVYLNDPATTAEEQLETAVFVSLA